MCRRIWVGSSGWNFHLEASSFVCLVYWSSDVWLGNINSIAIFPEVVWCLALLWHEHSWGFPSGYHPNQAYLHLKHTAPGLTYVFPLSWDDMTGLYIMDSELLVSWCSVDITSFSWKTVCLSPAAAHLRWHCLNSALKFNILPVLSRHCSSQSR